MRARALAWRPGASLAVLRARAALLRALRTFLHSAGILEVDTPILAYSADPEPALDPIHATCRTPGNAASRVCYLQTSPEFAMKRLVAAGSGPIFQITKAFRDGEVGRRHNPEFSLLEWYRPSFDHQRLMDEVGALVRHCLDQPDLTEERISYRALFRRYMGIDPIDASLAQLRSSAVQRISGVADVALDDRDGWLDILLTHHIEPKLGRGRLTFVYDYPRTQAALARLDPIDATVANRFELYFQGVELANGFNELRDPVEQERRFLADNRLRERLGKAAVPIDQKFLAALRHGMPDVSGVALGVDRLLMLQLGVEDIDQVLSFSWSRI